MKNSAKLIFTAVFFAAMTFAFTACGGDSFTDPRDGQKYKIVKIGDQVWMAEYLKFKGGADAVGDIASSFVWDSALVACPDGWHLPSKEELEVVASDTSFDYIWSSTEKEDFSLKAYRLYVKSVKADFKNKDAWNYYVRCVQGEGTKQPRLSEYKGYKAIRVGSQIWMKDYLTVESPNSVCYLDDSAECSKGRYYPYSEALNICPKGWHLPSKTEAIKYINTLKKEEAFMKGTHGYYDEKKGNYEDIWGETMLWTSSKNFLIIQEQLINKLKIDEFSRSVSENWKVAVRCIADDEDKKEE